MIDCFDLFEGLLLPETIVYRQILRNFWLSRVDILLAPIPIVWRFWVDNRDACVLFCGQTVFELRSICFGASLLQASEINLRYMDWIQIRLVFSLFRVCGQSLSLFLLGLSTFGSNSSDRTCRWASL